MSWVAAQWWIHRGRPQTLLERHAAAAAYLRHVQASLGDDRHAVCTLWRAACILAHAEELPDVPHANDLMVNGMLVLDKQQASQLELTPHHALRDMLGMLDIASLGRLALSCAAFGAPCRGVSWYGQQPDLSYGEAAIRSRCGDATYLRTLRPGRSAGPRLLSVHGRRRYTNALHVQRLLRGAASCDTAERWQDMRTAMAGRGCTVNAVDRLGRTAAYLAVAREQCDALRWLVRPPTDLLAVSRSGRTALMLAYIRGRGRAARMLVAAGKVRGQDVVTDAATRFRVQKLVRVASELEARAEQWG